ncbi:putative retrotransposon hot spot protein (RHS,) [Trypanosoma cruzi]|uniref:Putative retrotransposon hot spot protein (RHS,) n=1 Tax=Trypanosoma cruzi TaxID=5693 RepID=A0A2V2UJL3_TRYCR|nr:putative retrotransposon hot spot protein (RHS,) [Trypanosoma cruzi]
MKEKDTITPFARGKPNGALTQVPTEARREVAERLRGTQEMKFTISTTIEEVLFGGRARVKDIKLNDFLTRELDGRGALDANRDVLLEEFFKDPTKYIRDKGALNEIQASGRYLGMKRAVKGEVIFDEDIRRLYKNGVHGLLRCLVAAALFLFLVCWLRWLYFMLKCTCFFFCVAPRSSICSPHRVDKSFSASSSHFRVYFLFSLFLF